MQNAIDSILVEESTNQTTRFENLEAQRRFLFEFEDQGTVQAIDSILPNERSGINSGYGLIQDQDHSLQLNTDEGKTFRFVAFWPMFLS